MLYAAAAKSLQSCLTLCDPIDGSPPGSAIPGILRHFHLQCMKVKSEREVAQTTSFKKGNKTSLKGEFSSEHP